MRNPSNFLFKLLLCILPLCLFFSYHPVIRLGGDATMNFELSVAEIWLVVFDLVVVFLGLKRRVLFKGVKWVWLLFPLWLSLSVAWSLNTVRGVLTVGMLWLIYLAVWGMWKLRDVLDEEFWVKWLKWFLRSTLVVCAWCVVQCIMDLAGVPQECTLLCDGCTYHMFGFPHPNGFAIEPQFMGNLLLAPAIVAAWLIATKQTNRKTSRERSREVFLLVCFFVTVMTLFLTFSRGAIYALVVGLVVMSAVVLVREKKRRKEVGKRVGQVWGVVIVAFLVALVGQGVMAQVSPTSDTFGDGVAKVLNHLSLGIVDVRGAGDSDNNGSEVVENPVENSVDKIDESEQEMAVFDGYVAESTDTRLRLTGAAVEVWSMEPKNVLIGVGLGGAGQALYNNGLSSAPKEIVQNEYASLLLETGLVGVSLFVLTIALVLRIVWKSPMVAVMVGLIVAYGVSLLFFSGLPNALQIYLMPGVVWVVFGLSDCAVKKNASCS